jgi:hypothetical protein
MDLGGRIPVLRPDLMSDEQKQVYDRINKSQVPWAADAGFRVKADYGGLLGPYNSQLMAIPLADEHTRVAFWQGTKRLANYRRTCRKIFPGVFRVAFLAQ